MSASWFVYLMSGNKQMPDHLSYDTETHVVRLDA